jgi:protein-S-isoprenylcysteine O-methyltransferase Ste14
MGSVGFDPFGWLARRFPEALLHRCVRAAAAAVLAGFLALRVSQYQRFALKPLWAAETLLFAVLVAAYAVRRAPVERARGSREILVPLLGAVLPFGLLTSPPHPLVASHPAALEAVFWWMTAATAFTVWGLGCLGGSFSGTVEARAPVLRGPYRWVRHPVYLGEMATAAAVALWRWSLANAVLLALFVTVQLLRSRWEEGKLLRVFPAYQVLRQRSRWFW